MLTRSYLPDDRSVLLINRKFLLLGLFFKTIMHSTDRILWGQQGINISLNGEEYRSNYYKVGKGRPILFFHGWLHSGRIWQSMLPMVAGGYRLIAPDLPGFGESDAITANENLFNQYCDLNLQILNNFTDRDNPPVIVADSLSAVVMLMLFSENELPCRHLVLLGCPSDGLPGVIKFLRKATPFSLLLRAAQRQPEAILRTSLRYGNFLTMKNRNGNLNPLIHAIKSADIESSITLLDTILGPMSEFPPPTVPVTVLRGEFDRIVSRESSQKLAERLNAEYLEIQRSGHTPMIEQPETLIRNLQRILE